MTSRAKSTGILSRVSSTAIFCSALNWFVSFSHRTEPAPPLRMAVAGSIPGNAPTWVSWPTFSASVIWPSKAVTFCSIWASVRGAAETATAVPSHKPAAAESPLIFNMALSALLDVRFVAVPTREP